MAARHSSPRRARRRHEQHERCCERSERERGGALGGAGAVGVPGGGGGLSNGVTQGAIDPQVAAATIYASLRATPNGASLNAFTDDAVKREEGEPAREEEANGHGDGDTEVKAADAGEASGGDGERADEEQPRAAELRLGSLVLAQKLRRVLSAQEGHR